MKSINILIVEDERIIAKDIEATLLNLGYLVSGIVSSGEGAVSHVETYKPDIVIMDIY
jgi:AmiR/NasT family two-component response regulator